MLPHIICQVVLSVPAGRHLHSPHAVPLIVLRPRTEALGWRVEETPDCEDSATRCEAEDQQEQQHLDRAHSGTKSSRGLHSIMASWDVGNRQGGPSLAINEDQ